MMKMKVNELKSKCGAMFCIMMIMMSFLAFSAHAEGAGSEGVGVIVVVDTQSGEEMVYPAIAIQGNNKLVVYTAYKVWGEGDEGYYFIPHGEETPIEVEFAEIDDRMRIVGFYGEASGGYEVAKAREGQEVYLVGYDLKQQGFVQLHTSIESVSDSGEFFGAELSDYADDLFYPAAILDSENRCLGLVYDTSHVFLFVEPGGGNASGFMQKYWYLILAAVLGGIGGLVGSLRKMSEKNKESQPAAEIESQPASAPVSQAAPPQAPQQPIPPQYVPPQPIPPQPVPPTSPWNVPPQAPSAASKSSSQGSAVLRLRGVKGALSSREYPIGSGGLTIGRSADNTVAFPGDTKGVSREHCRIYWSRGMLMLMDVGSSYGTFLEGKGKLAANSPVALKNGDVFYVGSKEQAFRVEM